MADGHVIRLEVIIHRDFPIDVPSLLGNGLQGHHVFEPIGQELLGQLAPDRRHRRRIAGQADEDETEGNIRADGTQAMFGAVEPRETLANGHANQATVVPVRPAVIGADNGRGTVSRAIQQARAAMSAHIVKAAYRTIAIAQYHDAFRAQIESFVITRLGDGIDVAHDLPARHQNAFELEPGHLAVVVDPGGQCVRQGVRGLVGALRDG